MTESDSKLQKVKLFTAVYICLHRRTAHALDELHTWDLEHKKGYRKAKPFIFKTCWGHPEMAKGQPQHETDILSSHISARGDFL